MKKIVIMVACICFSSSFALAERSSQNLSQSQNSSSFFKYNAVIKRKFPTIQKDRLWLEETQIVRAQDSVDCRNSLSIQIAEDQDTKEGRLIKSGVCEQSDGTYDQVFNHRAISSWYFVVESKNGSPMAVIFKFFDLNQSGKEFFYSDSQKLAMVRAQATDLLMVTKESDFQNVVLYIVSPAGEVITEKIN